MKKLLVLIALIMMLIPVAVFAETYDAYSQTVIGTVSTTDSKVVENQSTVAASTVSTANDTVLYDAYSLQTSFESSAVSTTDNTNVAVSLLFSGLNAAGLTAASFASTARPIYSIDLINGCNGYGYEKPLYTYIPSATSWVKYDAAAGYLHLEDGNNHGEVSINVLANKELNLYILKTADIGVGAMVHHGFQGKAGAGINATTKITNIVGIPVKTIVETVFFWAKNQNK